MEKRLAFDFNDHPDFVSGPTIEPPVFNLPWQFWYTLNRFQTWCCHLHKWWIA